MEQNLTANKPWYEVAFNELYPVVYGHRDETEALLAASSFSGLFENRQPVWDIACGAGRHLTAFRGHDKCIFGGDLSEFLLAEAAAAGHEGLIVCADMRAVPILSESLGGVVSMFTSFGYFATLDENQAVFSEIARILRPGGVFLFDFLNARQIRQADMTCQTRESAGYKVKERKRLEENGALVVKSVEVFDSSGVLVTNYEERVRLFEREQLVKMLSQCGLGVVATYGDYQRAEFASDLSERLILVCEKS